MTLIKPITLEIEDKTWEKYKNLIPRTIKLNDSLVSLIQEVVRKKK